MASGREAVAAVMAANVGRLVGIRFRDEGCDSWKTLRVIAADGVSVRGWATVYNRRPEDAESYPLEMIEEALSAEDFVARMRSNLSRSVCQWCKHTGADSLSLNMALAAAGGLAQEAVNELIRRRL